MMRRLLVIPLVAAGVAVFAAPASATIVPGDSIAGVKIGATQKSVTKLLGTPSGTIEVADNEFKLEWRPLRLQVLVSGGKVLWVRTKSAGQRTATGLGRGTSLATLRASLSGERCTADVCFVTTRNNKRTTTYYLKKGKVTIVEVGRVQQAATL
jgi:hypothetical protein